MSRNICFWIDLFKTFCIKFKSKVTFFTGGIYDHVSDGFARYSTDENWHVPHFEKMLYDQGQLLVAYAQAYQATKEDKYREVINGILKYVTRDLRHEKGMIFP